MKDKPEPKLWEVIPDRTEETALSLRDPEGWFEAVVKWDGCVDLKQAGNMPFDDENGRSWEKRNPQAFDCYIHICDLDDIIKRLQALKSESLKHFKEWPQ